MGKQTAMQMHHKQWSKVQEMLVALLEIKTNNKLAEGMLTGQTNNNTEVEISILKQSGEQVGSLIVDQYPILQVRAGDVQKSYWGFEFDPKNGYIVDTTEFKDEKPISGRIAFTYAGRSNYTFKLNYLKILLKNVHEWNLA